jgi:capsular exopolysaccharide synthesis family protein
VEPQQLFRALRKRWLVIALLGLLGLAVGLTLSRRATPQYQASATLYLSVTKGESVSDLSQGSTYTQNLLQSFAAVATKPVVLEPVISNLRLDTSVKRLASTIKVTVPSNTVLLQIAATDPSPEEAARVANAVADQVARAVVQLSPLGPDDAKPIKVTTVARADVPRYPISPNTRRSLAEGLLLGTALGVAVAVLRYLSDSRVRDEEAVARVTEVPVVGAIGVDRSRTLVQAGGQSPAADAFRRLRTNFVALDLTRGTSLAITSPGPDEGKTTTAVNLAVTMAEAGNWVLLIDANLREPSLADRLGIDGSSGLIALLAGQVGLEGAVQQWGAPNLHVLSAEHVPQNSSELLGSERMANLLTAMAEPYDVVILDAPAVLSSADAAVVSQQVDGVLLVVDAKRTHRDQLTESLHILDMAKGHPLGIVLNRVDTAPSTAGSWLRRHLPGRLFSWREPATEPTLPQHVAVPHVGSKRDAASSATVSPLAPGRGGESDRRESMAMRENPPPDDNASIKRVGRA